MEIKIIKENENKLIKRKEIDFEVNYPKAPPKKIEILDELSKKMNVDKNLIVIRKVVNVFGMRRMVGNAHVYSDIQILKKFEPKHILERVKRDGEEKKSKGKEGEEKTKKD